MTPSAVNGTSMLSPDQASESVAIIGAGPAGCALACLLRLRGLPVLLFDNGKRPELLVGESLVPAAVTHLRSLGIEDAVSRIAVRKPGALLRHFDGAEIPFVFRDRGSKAPGYAYNVPRGEFDLILKQRAQQLGVRIVAHDATFDIPAEGSDREIQLSSESLSEAGLTHHPQLLVDSTGRSRLFSRLLKIPARRGKRNDVAYFAHYENFCHAQEVPGQVVISVLKSGWSWSIPLPGRTSVGVVLNRHAARRFGDTPVDRLTQVLESDPLLASRSSQATRITAVKTYTNYQQITTQGAGRGWALLGDAFGFVDPMLSPGVFMALESAALFSRCTELPAQRGVQFNYQHYASELTEWHSAWQEIIEYFYDGRMVNLAEAGKSIADECARYSTSRLANWHVRRVIGDLVSGVGTRSRYNRAVLNKSARYLVENTDDLARLAIQK